MGKEAEGGGEFLLFLFDLFYEIKRCWLCVEVEMLVVLVGGQNFTLPFRNQAAFTLRFHLL